MERLAIVLFNLGGPDSLQAVRPFLFNLFSDPAIISLPAGLRQFVAWMVAKKRGPAAAEIYAKIGGASPLLPETQAQAAALQKRLAAGGGREVRAFVAMRYWHPMTEQTVAEVAAWRPDRVVLLPLYPQFSSTTTASSLAAWRKVAAQVGLTAPTQALCCYPTNAGMVAAQAELLAQTLAKMEGGAPVRVLFSAHGLPKRVVERGDPYPDQVMMTAQAVVAALGRPDLDWRVCYQSRVGPLEWIGPSTEAEIHQAGREGKALAVLPIAFVSEHSETLVELDMDYAALAGSCGVPAYGRVPALGVHPRFIDGLAALVESVLAGGAGPCSERGTRICPAGAKACPMAG
jgi:ferrochelatase